MLKYKGYTLDPFQEEAVNQIEQNFSVVVSAPTGTGKTLIADYLITKHLGKGKRIFYTAPIKALSNQKYRDFVKDFGWSNVGILTGDVTINHDAPIVIMTTEVYRNMVVKKDSELDDLAYVIFDEIHFINDIERGTVWEESIIFSPEHVRFLCLSATIPNAREFSDWIESIKHHKVKVVTWDKRAVPLENLIFDGKSGLVKLEEFIEKKGKNRYNRTRNRGKRDKNSHGPTHLELISYIKNRDFMPLLYFSFSRNSCEKKAKKLSKIFDFASKKEKQRILEIFNSKIDRNISVFESVRIAKSILLKGIGVHHAGLLPALKEATELMFSEGLIKVLYTTETFAVGINMPAKTVCFDSLRKYDGHSFRFLNSKEYFQLAGRAGRRGIDEKGWAIIMYDKRSIPIGKLSDIAMRDIEPLKSQYKLSYNTVLNLIARFNNDIIKKVLNNSYYYYQKKEENSRTRILSTYGNIIKKLKSLDFVDENNELTYKGKFASGIYANEVLVTEIFATDLWKKLSLVEINIIIASIAYEPRLNDYFKFPKNKNGYKHILDIISENEYLKKNLNKKSLLRIYLFVEMWSKGADFSQLLEVTNLQEGDIIRLIRQIIDYEQQIKKACWDSDLSDRMEEAIKLIKRDLAKFDFEGNNESDDDIDEQFSDDTDYEGY